MLLMITIITTTIAPSTIDVVTITIKGLLKDSN